MSEDRCNAIRFNDVCHLFERIEKVSGGKNKLKILFNEHLKTYLKGRYGLKQASLAKAYVAALHLQKESPEALMLVFWKDPSKAASAVSKISDSGGPKVIAGDFGSILESVLSPRVRTEQSTLTIGQ
jgi:hypothetical protein